MRCRGRGRLRARRRRWRARARGARAFVGEADVDVVAEGLHGGVVLGVVVEVFLAGLVRAACVDDGFGRLEGNLDVVEVLLLFVDGVHDWV